MKILLAMDESEFSQAAIRAVVKQIPPQGAEVLVLSVVEPLVHYTIPQMAPGYAPEMAARLEEELKQARESVAKAAQVLRGAGFKADTRVVEGEVRAGILDVASDLPADLIVVGSHGRKGLQKFLLGSVAESVARHARCSVLIVRLPSNR
jgi:nucleotide-binding universal stress UspA family protein